MGPRVDELADRLGWRALWLVMVGSAWIVLGAGASIDRQVDRPWVLTQILPTWVLAVGWWVTGAVAIGVGLRGKGHDDGLGHLALYLMPAAKSLSFIAAWVIALVSPLLQHTGMTSHPVGDPDGWYAATIWGTTSLMLGVVAGWPNPDPLPIPPADPTLAVDPTADPAAAQSPAGDA
ncbi:hypothetical protein [Nocardioides sp. GY 10127]|uniref:hypothetical protein n=1 Tax=Nocardioides sp. GY 10127 TaxID=2569762 RepID=UPI0010A9249F|nr:hypothetical protein [Nocardioides sp. GY 10127]TIC78765.1 hypothetical protein E8D37_18895 [Nocardioides sp. GY 10127]